MNGRQMGGGSRKGLQVGYELDTMLETVVAARRGRKYKIFLYHSKWAKMSTSNIKIKS